MGITSRKSLLGTGLALLAALLVVLCLALALPGQARADEGDETELTSGTQEATPVTVALTIVDTEDNAVLYNGKVANLKSSDTVADLLAAVGFHQVTAYAGDPMSYVETYGSPYFIGKDYNAETNMYWATMFNGDAMNDYAKAFLTASLEDGGHYQYVYAGWDYAFEYNGAIPDPLATEPTKATQLLNNLSARFGKGGADGKISKAGYNAALALSYLGKGRFIDSDSIRESAADAGYAGALAKYVIALAAAGDDAAAAELLGKIDTSLEKAEDIYSKLIILPAYDMVGTPPSGALYTTEALVNDILAEQAESGLFPKDYSGTQETAEAIFALAPYAKDASFEGIGAALEKARAALLKDFDPETGTLPPSAWAQGYAMDYDGMGEAIDAIVTYDLACGNPVGSEVGKMADALVNAADATLDGYVDAGTFDEIMTTASVFRGLAAAHRAGWNEQNLNDPVDKATKITKATVSKVSNKTYSGKAIKPAVTVKYNGKKLVKGTDYTLAYKNNKKAGKAKIYIKGKGFFKGTKTVTFKIVAAKITKAKFGKIAKKKYSGKAIKPAVTVKFNGKKLKKGTDYTVKYKNNKKVGKAQVIVKGKGNFKGTKTLTFKIVKK